MKYNKITCPIEQAMEAAVVDELRNGNAYTEGVPIYKVEILEDGCWFPKGTIIEVIESLNPSFKNHWRINDSRFISKDYCKVVE